MPVTKPKKEPFILKEWTTFYLGEIYEDKITREAIYGDYWFITFVFSSRLSILLDIPQPRWLSYIVSEFNKSFLPTKTNVINRYLSDRQLLSVVGNFLCFL